MTIAVLTAAVKAATRLERIPQRARESCERLSWLQKLGSEAPGTTAVVRVAGAATASANPSHARHRRG